jgi:uncharacterized protein (TIGR04255 family)
MATVNQLDNPPITEALLDIQISVPENISPIILFNLLDKVKDFYPQVQQNITNSFEIQGQAGSGMIKPSTTLNGLIFISNEGDKVFQARINGFSFSKLQKYKNWVEIKQEAQNLWELYKQILGKFTVTRLGVRYINRINIPADGNDFRKYILTTPEIAPGIPQGLAEFYMRLVIPFNEKQVAAIVTQSSDPTNQDKSVYPIIFDIDVSKGVSLDQNSPEIWEIFEDIRVIKNNIFFSSVTDQAIKELF